MVVDLGALHWGALHWGALLWAALALLDRIKERA
jgi:hypothetical protein